MGSATVLSICNRALLQIGSRTQVSSVNPSDGSQAGDACSTLYTPTFEALARTARWNCLRKQATLSLQAAAMGTPENPIGTSMPQPPTPWLYAYFLPSDCLAMRFLVPSLPSEGNVSQTGVNNQAPTYLPSGGQIVFDVAYSYDQAGNPIQIVLTNQMQAQAVYTVNQPNPTYWDSLFEAGMVSSLAAYLVPALTGNQAALQLAIASAERVIRQARAADGNEGVTVMDHVPDWIRARAGASGYAGNWGNGFYSWAPFCEMTWPGS